jgi:hypothetical protein
MPLLKRMLLVFLCLVPALCFGAEVAVGATREEVMAQLGAPKSKMGSGTREIFTYPKGRIVFADGKVVSIEWKGEPSIPPAPAKPADAKSP